MKELMNKLNKLNDIFRIEIGLIRYIPLHDEDGEPAYMFTIDDVYVVNAAQSLEYCAKTILRYLLCNQ